MCCDSQLPGLTQPRGLVANVCLKLIIGGEGYLLPLGCKGIFQV